MSEAVLDGKVIIVTGGAAGIGSALCTGLAEAGGRVVVVDRDGARAAALAGDIGAGASALAADVSDPESGPRALAFALDTFGRLDGLINNAGIGMNLFRDDHETTPVGLDEIGVADWHRFFAVNAHGAFHMVKAAAPHFLAQGSGRIVNVTTSMFTMLRRGFVPYGPTKAAIEAASAAWAVEFAGTGVTVNVLVPGGPTDTAMVTDEAFADRAGLIRPKAMAPPAIWLLSDAAAAVTGQRFIAAKWDPALAPAEAAENAGAPAAWPQLSGTVVWPGAVPKA